MEKLWKICSAEFSQNKLLFLSFNTYRQTAEKDFILYYVKIDIVHISIIYDLTLYLITNLEDKNILSTV